MSAHSTKIGPFEIPEASTKHRLDTLCDGIFAVAMTLLVLDITNQSLI